MQRYHIWANVKFTDTVEHTFRPLFGVTQKRAHSVILSKKPHYQPFHSRGQLTRHVV